MEAASATGCPAPRLPSLSLNPCEGEVTPNLPPLPSRGAFALLEARGAWVFGVHVRPGLGCQEEAGTAQGSFMQGKELVYLFREISSPSVFVIAFRASLRVGFGVLVAESD